MENTQFQAVKKRENHVFSRIFAIVFAVAPIALFFFFNMLLIADGAFANGKLLSVVKDLFKGDHEKLFGILPLLNNCKDLTGLDKYIALGSSLALYALALSTVVCVVLAIIAICNGKAAAALCRAIWFIHTITYGAYVAIVFYLAKKHGLKIDYTSLPAYVLGGAFGGSLLLYFFYSIARTGKTAILNFVLFLLTAGFVGSYIYLYYFKSAFGTTFDALAKDGGKYWLIGALTNKQVYGYGRFVLTGIGVLATLISIIRISSKKGYGFDILRGILHLIVAAFVVVTVFLDKAFKDFAFMDVALFAIIAAACVVLKLIICIVAKHHGKKAKKEEAEEAPVEEAEEEAEEEAPAEEEAEEVAPIAAEEEAPVEEEETATEEEPVSEDEIEEVIEPENEYPAPAYYTSKCYDSFIAGLDEGERKEFTEVFILKFFGDLDHIPDYVVGGDNKEFFRNIFIYLGQYRSIISSPLLEKIYAQGLKK